MTGEPLDLFAADEPPALGHRVLVGTSGYSFRDWIGPFYPAGIQSGDLLRYYARHFNAVEVNSTYYGIPKPRVLEQMEKKTPDGFHFVVKLNQEMTHRRRTDAALYRDFHDAIAPLRAAGKLDGLLAQFPMGFHRDTGSEAHLRLLRERFPGDALFVEFRHESWITPALGAELRGLDLGYTAVDEPALPGLVPPIAMVTAADAYVRFHGRNADNWWGGRGDRYDYLYREGELREWLKKIGELADQARRTYLFFNNCHAGQAARNAKLMQELVRQQKLA